MSTGFYDTSILANHNHGATPGDGGTLSNLSVLGTLTAAGLVTAGGGVDATSDKIINQASGVALTDAANIGQLKVVQIIMGTTITNFSTASATFVNTNLTASITPTSASNKVMILAWGTMQTGTANNECFATLARGGVNLLGAAGGLSFFGTGQIETPASLGFIDSPASTSSLTYTVQIKTSGSNCNFGSANLTQVMILLEVLA